MKDISTRLKLGSSIARLPRIRKYSWRFNQRGLFIGIVLLLIVLSLLSPRFRQPDNFMLILQEASLIGIVAAGQTLVVLTGGIDLSVGSMLAFASIITALLMTGVSVIPPQNPYVAIAAAFGLSGLIGAGQGFLISRHKMPPFIVTLVSFGILRSVTLLITESRTIHSITDDFKWISDANIRGFPVSVIIMLGIFFVLDYILSKTKLGRYIFRIGANETSARLSGVLVDKCKTYTYMLSGVLAALSGIILIARLDGAVYTLGEDYGLNSVAAVIIGGTSLSGGVGGMRRTLIGVFIVAVVQNGLVQLNVAYPWHGIVIGSIILLAVFIDFGRQRSRQYVTKVRPYPSAGDTTYLEGIIAQVNRNVRNRFASTCTRIYMIDPGLDMLVDCDDKQRTDPSLESISEWVKNSGQAIVVDDISDRGDISIDRLDPRSKSAAVIPLSHNDQLIGALEVQSRSAHAFLPEDVDRLVEQTEEIVPQLRNAWLLECEWLQHQTRNALRHLWDSVYLGRCPLAEWAFPANLDSLSRGFLRDRSEQLRRLLLDRIEKLNPEKNINRPNAIDRRYDILRLTYVEGLSSNDITKRLSISRRQYFYDLKEAIGALAHLLVHSI
jgi:ribose/xylose/arabinose/galactoside ABC-type transport system permease subunit